MDSRPDQRSDIAYYDSRWYQEQDKISSEEVLRISRLLWAFTFIAQREQGRISGAPLPTMRICDLGCGVGRVASCLAALGQVTGIDYSAKGIEVARRRFPSVDFQVADVTSYRVDESFDVVVSTEVIEHVPDKVAYSTTCREVLRPGGYLILTCPNGRYRQQNRDRKISDQPVEEWPTRRELQDLFAGDFDILFFDTFRTDYFNTGINRLINSYKLRSIIRHMSLSSLYDAFIGRMGSGLYQLMIAQRRHDPGGSAG